MIRYGQSTIAVENAVKTILEHIGEDPNREGLKDTPRRVLKAYDELFYGYQQNPESIFRTFEDGACSQMVVLRGIEWVSFCEHHMLPMLGKAHIGYIPNGKVVGISKLARLLEIFSRRLQIQERIGQQITEALDKYLTPKGSACVLEAQHLCMSCRGVNKQQSVMVTSSISGEFFQPEVRAEFLTLIRGIS